ncbi:MAG: hypothetical protein GTN40_03835 [Candidatus Aenigmarchaeota archaeon]|nr:hypothetical protein [Candidatus Aenigmarchaeota archaeon]
MKGIDTLIAAVFIILISIVGIIIVLETSQSSIGRLEEISLMEEGRDILTQIDNAVRDVAQQGEGSSRVLTISVSGGNYFIDTENEAVVFSMSSHSQILGVGISKTEGNINMFGEINRVFLNISHSNVNITEGGRFGRGYHNLFIRNNGYDFANQKQIISISLIPVLPPTAITVQFNQSGSPLIVSGIYFSGSADDLNTLGEGSTYDVEEEGSVFGESQYARPSSDFSTGNWLDYLYSEPLYDDIDEITVDDADYIQSSINPSVDVCDIGLSSVTDPEVHTGHIVRYRYAAVMSGTGKPSEIDLVVRLMEGTTEIASWSHSNLAGDLPFVTSTQTLTEEQASLISDYSNLRLRFIANRVGRGTRDIWIEISWTEFEIQGEEINYEVEVWHNSTPISYSGNLYSINVTVNFTTNFFDTYSLQIYDWTNLQWTSTGCGSGDVQPDTPTQWWCTENIDPMNYNSSDNIVRIRIKSTADSDQGTLKEDYIQYFVNYIPPS